MNILLIIAFLMHIFLFVSNFFISDEKWAGRIKILSLILGAAGALLAATSAVIFLIKTSSLDAADSSWANETYFSFVKILLIIALFSAAVIIGCSLMKLRFKVMRSLAVSVCGIFILVYTYFCSIISESDILPVNTYVVLFGTGISVLISIYGYFDFKQLQIKLRSSQDGKQIR